MKNTSLKIVLAFLMMLPFVDAHAVACARGVYRAGCAGPNGAVVRRNPVVVAPRAVVVPPPRYPVGCRWVNGVRICR
jgi:hypothetical protein